MATIDVLQRFAFTRLPPATSNADMAGCPSNTINWFIPPCGEGSGGHLNIFRFVAYLEAAGFECRIIVVGGPDDKDPLEAQSEIARWFLPVAARVSIGLDQAPSAHFAFATGWQSAYFVRAFHKTRHRCYFVQDFEPLFYAAGSEAALAERTYQFGLIGVTAGEWLREKLATEFGMTTYSISFSYDKTLYMPAKAEIQLGPGESPHTGPAAPQRTAEPWLPALGAAARRLFRPAPDIARARYRIFFYARPSTARRAFELGILALDLVARRLEAVEVVFAGGSITDYDIPFRHVDKGILSPQALADTYHQCDAALVLSFSNVSFVPLELMACGVPVVSNRSACTNWLLNDANTKLAAPTAEDLADALCTVLTDSHDAERLITAGFAAAAATSWQREGQKLVDILRHIDAAT